MLYFTVTLNNRKKLHSIQEHGPKIKKKIKKNSTILCSKFNLRTVIYTFSLNETIKFCIKQNFQR